MNARITPAKPSIGFKVTMAKYGDKFYARVATSSIDRPDDSSHSVTHAHTRVDCGYCMDTKVQHIVTADLAPETVGKAGGLAVAVYAAGYTQFFNYGFADGSTKRPITSDTLFNVASVRKPFRGDPGRAGYASWRTEFG